MSDRNTATSVVYQPKHALDVVEHYESGDWLPRARRAVGVSSPRHAASES